MISAIRDIVTKTIEEWNANVNQLGHKYHIECNVSIRIKKFYIDKKNFLERGVAELTLLQVKDDPSEKDFLLYRKEVILRPGDYNAKGKVSNETERDYTNHLYRCLLYEAIGIFTIATRETIISQDYAEYDIVNDRLKQHESAVGMVIKSQVAGPFYEVGTEFDVFMDMDGEEKYAVYTQHEAGRGNNGIAIVPHKDFMVIEAAKKSIILLK